VVNLLLPCIRRPNLHDDDDDVVVESRSRSIGVISVNWREVRNGGKKSGA
jgi:hypothetical protein